MAAAYSVAARRGWRIAWVAGGAAALTLLAVGLIIRPSGQLAANMYAFDLVLSAAGAGTLIRSRRLRLQAREARAIAAEQTREEEARRRVAAERLRMARELHDVVAHNLALVNAQSSVAEYLPRSDPTAAAKALHDITRHTQQALDELRSTVGLLRQADDDPASDDQLRPLHGLSDLGDLVTLHRDAGAEVTMTVAGKPHPLPAISELATSRIVQEALTNATKHAPGAAVKVKLRWTNDGLELGIDNDASPPGEQVPAGGGTGHGLIGMRERALAARGSLRSGPRSQGGFTVTATIPIGDDEVNEREGPS